MVVLPFYVHISTNAGPCACLSGLTKPRCAPTRRGCSAVNKRLLDGGFGGKSWLEILINHWPSCWILTSLYSFTCCCCSLSCPPACSSPVYAYPVNIPPLLSSLWIALPLFLSLSSPPSSLLLSTIRICVATSFFSSHLSHSLLLPSCRPGFLKAWPSPEPPKDPSFPCLAA